MKKLALIFGLIIAVSLSVPALAASNTGTITGKITVQGLRDAGDTVVYIASAPGTFAPPKPLTSVQKDMSFQPRVMPVVVGTTVNFSNSDNVQHPLYTPSPAGDFFNLGILDKGQSKPHTFTKMGKVELLCNVHHEMHGFILVLQNPFFAVTDKNGNFTIANVPPGNYQLKVWNEKGNSQPQTIQVSAGAQAVNFNVVAK